MQWNMNAANLEYKTCIFDIQLQLIGNNLNQNPKNACTFSSLNINQNGSLLCGAFEAKNLPDLD